MDAVDLYWLPLGAGERVVRLSGRAFEVLAAHRAHRPRCALYHSALRVRLGTTTYVVEMAPAAGHRGEARGVVAEGAVGSSLLGGLPQFRYELRCWRDGVLADIAEAVASPERVSSDDAPCARRVLELVAQVPTAVWGRDGLRTGEMWNSNSVVAWLLVRSGIDVAAVHPPAGGRAPGWGAGLVAASRTRGRRFASAAVASQ